MPNDGRYRFPNRAFMTLEMPEEDSPQIEARPRQSA
jgi:hypothetical protein